MVGPGSKTELMEEAPFFFCFLPFVFRAGRPLLNAAPVGSAGSGSGVCRHDLEEARKMQAGRAGTSSRRIFQAMFEGF